MNALLSVSSCCAVYVAFACLHAASLERLPACIRARVAPSPWRAAMYVGSAALSASALLAWASLESLYAAVLLCVGAASLAGTAVVLLRPRWPRALFGSALVALLVVVGAPWLGRLL